MASESQIARESGAGVGRYRWRICALLFWATTVNYIDRMVLGVLAPSLGHALGWTQEDYGYIVAAFQSAYAVGLLFSGRLIDRLGTRIGYAISIAVWSVAAMSHALARTVLEFVAARFVLGLGESANFPAAFSISDLLVQSEVICASFSGSVMHESRSFTRALTGAWGSL